jgi:hypothetical protein
MNPYGSCGHAAKVGGGARTKGLLSAHTNKVTTKSQSYYRPIDTSRSRAPSCGEPGFISFPPALKYKSCLFRRSGTKTGTLTKQ